MAQEEEIKALSRLQSLGYTIVVCNPRSPRFSVKYTVFKKENRLEGSLIVVDDNGNLVGS